MEAVQPEPPKAPGSLEPPMSASSLHKVTLKTGGDVLGIQERTTMCGSLAFDL